jgi:hypothetical protein
MAGETDTVTTAMAEVDRLRAALKKKKTNQVRGEDERSLAKATALAWFNGHRKTLPATIGAEALASVDALYQEILDASDRATARTTYATRLKQLREALIILRKEGLAASTMRRGTTDQAPDFSPLISDPQMQEILKERWRECVQCIEAEAPLSATVMMGGLLETLLLGRINREKDKAPVFRAKSAPKDKDSGKTKPLGEWMLKSYIGVSHDLKWISVSAKEVAEVLMEFRNYIHPHKQFAHGVRLTGDDAKLLWEVSKSISVQVLKSCK